MATLLAPLGAGSNPSRMPDSLMNRSTGRLGSKMPGVGNAARIVQSDTNIGGRSKVADSIAQARAELRGHGTATAKYISPVLQRSSMITNNSTGRRRPSIRAEAANDTNMWSREVSKIAGSITPERLVPGSRHNNLGGSHGLGLLPKLSDNTGISPGLSATSSDEEGRHHSHKHKRKKHHKKSHKRKLKSLTKKRARARKKKYSAVKLQRWFRHKNKITVATIRIQRQLRRMFAITRVDLVRQAHDAGVMVAIRGTVQGKSGWYQDFDGQVYFFAVDLDGTWWEVVAQHRWTTYKLQRSKELQNVPVLVAGANIKIGDSGVYDEFVGNLHDSKKREWICVEGIFRRVNQ